MLVHATKQCASLYNGVLLEEQVKGVSQSQNGVVQKNLVLVDTANNVHHDIRLHLVQNNSVVVENNVAGLLGSLLNETLLESLLRLDIGVGVGGSAGRSCLEQLSAVVAPSGIIAREAQERIDVPLGAE